MPPKFFFFFNFFFCFQPQDWDSPFGVKLLGKGKLLAIPTLEAKGRHSLGRYPCVWVLYAAHLHDTQSGCLELWLWLVLDRAGYISEYIYTVWSSASNITRGKPLWPRWCCASSHMPCKGCLAQLGAHWIRPHGFRSVQSTSRQTDIVKKKQHMKLSRRHIWHELKSHHMDVPP